MSAISGVLLALALLLFQINPVKEVGDNLNFVSCYGLIGLKFARHAAIDSGPSPDVVNESCLPVFLWCAGKSIIQASDDPEIHVRSARPCVLIGARWQCRAECSGFDLGWEKRLTTMRVEASDKFCVVTPLYLVRNAIKNIILSLNHYSLIGEGIDGWRLASILPYFCQLNYDAMGIGPLYRPIWFYNNVNPRPFISFHGVQLSLHYVQLMPKMTAVTMPTTTREPVNKPTWRVHRAIMRSFSWCWDLRRLRRRFS